MGQFGTSMGQWMDQTTRSWLIYKLTGSLLQLGMVSFFRGLPMLLFGVIAGVVADRYSRKAQLIIAQMVNAALNITLATLVITGHIQVWHVYVTAFLSGTVQAFQQPARNVLIGEIVGGNRLQNAIALNSAVFNASRGIGPAIAGLLITAVDTWGSYYVQGALYIFASIWTIQMRVPDIPFKIARAAGKTTAAQQSFFGSLREGVSYIVHNQIILALMILALAPILLGMPYTSLMPAFAKDVFNGTANTQGLLIGAVGIGALIGSLSVASMGSRQGSGKLLIGGAAVFGLSLVLFSRSPTWHVAMIFTFFAGLSNSAYTTQDQTIIQTLAPANMRGRVLGVYFLDRGLMPIGSLLAGILAARLNSAPWAVTIMGASCFVLAIIMAIAVPGLLKLGAPAAKTAKLQG
jgi:MFS family permease